MKKRIRMWGACLIAAAGLASAALITDDFESLSNGNLVGQDSWALTVTTPQVTDGPTGTVNTSKVLSNGSVDGNVVAEKAFFSSGLMSASDVIILEFDVYVTDDHGGTGAGSYTMFGVGRDSKVSAMFGVASRNIVVRGENYGTEVYAQKAGGGTKTIAYDTWYTFRSVWDLSANGGAGLAELYIKNLTAGDTEFTQLFFDAAQTQTSASLGLTTVPEDWTTGYVRVSDDSALTTYMDNLLVVATVAGQSTTNGTPFSWLDQYGLTNYIADDVLDQDADGLLTWQEYIAGTVPTNAASVLKVAQANLNEVVWIAQSNRIYSVYWSKNLVEGFTNLADNIVYPQGSYTNTLPDDKVNHYQIKVRLP